MRYVPPAFPIANISIANTHYDLVDRVQILIDLMNSRHIFLLDDISPYFNGAQTTFYMTAEGGNEIYASTAMNLLIDLNGTRQEPQAAYTVYKNEITFTSPPLEGTSFHGVVMDVWAERSPDTCRRIPRMREQREPRGQRTPLVVSLRAS